MNLRHFITFIVLSFSLYLDAQSTYNRIYDEGLVGQQISDCIVNDTTLTYISSAIDTASFSVSFAKTMIDLFNGNPLSTEVYIDTFNRYQAARSTIVVLNDSTLLTAVTNSTKNQIELYEFSPNKPFNFVKSITPFHEQWSDFLFVLNIERDEITGNLCLISNQSRAGEAGSDLIVYCLNEEYNEIWRRNLVGQQIDVSGNDIIFRNSVIHIFGINSNRVDVDKNFRYYCVRYDLDEEGRRINVENTDQDIIRNPDYESIILENGDMILSASRGYEVCNSFGQACVVLVNNSIIRTDPDMNLIWENNEGTLDTAVSTGYFDLIDINEQQSVVAVGTAWDTVIDDQAFRMGVMTKIGYDGTTKWLRHYLYEGSEYPVDGRLRAVAQSPDGGYVAAGFARIYAPADARITTQQAWVLKVDDYGCIVPGCQLISSTNEIDDLNEVTLKSFPNPTTDYLSVYSNYKSRELAFIELYDINGRLLRRAEQKVPNLTVTWNIQDLNSGIYTILLKMKNKVLARESVIIQH